MSVLYLTTNTVPIMKVAHQINKKLNSIPFNSSPSTLQKKSGCTLAPDDGGRDTARVSCHRTISRDSWHLYF